MRLFFFSKVRENFCSLQPKKNIINAILIQSELAHDIKIQQAYDLITMTYDLNVIGLK
jgi:hypothetical protein